MSYTIDATELNFAETLSHSEAPTLVDFWAPWCGPCRLLAPVMDRVAEQYSGRVQVVRVNVDTSPALSEAYGIRSIPTLILFSGSEPIARRVGLVPLAELSAILDDALDVKTSAP
jgi:thioredoxin 1